MSSNGFIIKEYNFDKNGAANVASEKYGSDWPVVYLIHNGNKLNIPDNKKELYVGETSSATNRMNQHLKNPERSNLTTINIIFDSEFNKSAILDIEQNLIQLFAADKMFKLQNLNGGQSEKHNYYQREKYINKVDDIWENLHKRGLTNNTIEKIKNNNLFKYSPYNTLTSEQLEASRLALYDMMDKIRNGIDGTSIINGAAGTGKTIVLINMIYKIALAQIKKVDFSLEEEDFTESQKLMHDLQEFLTEFKEKHNRDFKVAYVVPQTSLRKTISVVFKSVSNILYPKMVMGPYGVFKDEYDLVFVDEAHRLNHYKNNAERGHYKEKADLYGVNPNDITMLDFIVKNSKYRILIYDENQTVKGSDITKEEFEKALENSSVSKFNLQTQMRCKGGSSYINYLDNIFNCIQKEKITFDLDNEYDFKLFDNVNDMIEKIKSLDKKYALCRNAAGYSWEWKSKGINDFNEIIKQGKEDIEIDGYKYVWNVENQEFILSKNSVNEIGCIHTLQGYDLNYIGIIFGREIDYNPETNSIEIDLNKFYDVYVKQDNPKHIVDKYIINSYKVLMSRGIKGCYVYCYNENLRKYLSKYIDRFN